MIGVTGSRKARMLVPAMLTALVLLASACGQSTGSTQPQPQAKQDTPAQPAAQPAARPGQGKSVRMARPTWDTSWFQAQVFAVLLAELGYEVKDVGTLQNPAFYQALAQGEVDFWAEGWVPLHNTYLEDKRVQGKVELVGFQSKAGALQGYLIDKKTSAEHGIKNLEQLKDPRVARLFDANGNGKADLIGCPPGWGCELVIEHHLTAYGLRNTVEHIQGEYNAMMAQTVARLKQGKPVLFYTWTPNWTTGQLVPGKDVVWIEVPRADLPKEQKAMEPFTEVKGVEGCVNDPCRMGWPANDIRVAANKKFLQENPAAARLFELVEIPVNDISAQNDLMEKGQRDVRDIRRHAEEWVQKHRSQVDQWLAAARQAAR